jgi:hypothetical protein
MLSKPRERRRTVGTVVGSCGWLPPVGWEQHVEDRGRAAVGKRRRLRVAESGRGRERRRQPSAVADMDWVRWEDLLTTSSSVSPPASPTVLTVSASGGAAPPPPSFYSWIGGCHRHDVHADRVLPLCPRAATPPPPPPQLCAQRHSLCLRSILACSPLVACHGHGAAHVVRMAAAEASSLLPHPRPLPSPPPLPPLLTAIAALAR